MTLSRFGDCYKDFVKDAADAGDVSLTPRQVSPFLEPDI